MEQVEKKDQSRATQTWIIAGAILTAAAAILAFLVLNKDFSSMDPMQRCESAIYRFQNNWPDEQRCKYKAAAAGLRGERFYDRNQ